MLSDRSYAKFFGNTLIEEIFHLDEELAQAVANKQDPLVEEELERSMGMALFEQDQSPLVTETKQPAKFHVYSAFGGKKLSSHPTESGAHKAATKQSHKQPVHVWTAEGGENGMGKPVAHYHNGVKTQYESFERGVDDLMKDL